MSNVTECHMPSVQLSTSSISSISPSLVPVPNFRSLVTVVYPVLHCLLAFVASFLSTTFGAQLTCDPFPHFSSTLALQVIEIFCPDGPAAISLPRSTFHMIFLPSFYLQKRNPASHWRCLCRETNMHMRQLTDFQGSLVWVLNCWNGGVPPTSC